MHGHGVGLGLGRRVDLAKVVDVVSDLGDYFVRLEVYDFARLGPIKIKIDDGEPHLARLPGPALREEDSDPRGGFGKMLDIVLRVIHVIFERPDALPGLQAVELDEEFVAIGLRRRHD